MSIDVEARYRQYGPMVLRRCRRLLGDEERAVEAMHDVFVQLLRRRETLADDAPSSLLYRMATNVCLNHIRSQKRRPETPQAALMMQIAVADDVEGRAARRELINRIFRREAPSTGSMAVMHLVDGMTLEEVAVAHDLSVSGVRKRLRTLKARVQEMEARDAAA